MNLAFGRGLWGILRRAVFVAATRVKYEKNNGLLIKVSINLVLLFKTYLLASPYLISLSLSQIPISKLRGCSDLYVIEKKKNKKKF